MYHTPDGDRILLGAERRFYTQSLAMVVDLLADGDLEFGVVPFGELQRNQKLLVLYQSARGLLRPDEPAPKLTAYIESAVATVFEHAIDQVYQEVENSDCSADPSYWRRLVLDAVHDQIAPDEPLADTECDKETWTILVECLAECVLWDNDYEFQASLDLPPEKSQQFRDLLGIADDYYTDVPPDPPDDQVNLYVDALMGLMADAR